MDISQFLVELRKERDAIDIAIKDLEVLAQNRPRGPGRPRIFRANGHRNGMHPPPAKNGE